MRFRLRRACFTARSFLARGAKRERTAKLCEERTQRKGRATGVYGVSCARHKSNGGLFEENYTSEENALGMNVATKN